MDRRDATAAATAYWDAVGEVWTDERRDALWRGYCDQRNRALLARWLPADRVAGRLLKTDVFDEAVSAGVYRALREHLTCVVGVDVSPVMLRAARTQYPDFGVAAADVRNLPCGDGTFDMVVSISTLDHFDSVDAIRVALGELHRVLRSGGMLIVTLDNAAHPTVALRNRLPFGLLRRLGVPYQVGVTCDGRALAAMLASAGFDLRVLTYVEHCPRWLAVRVAHLLTHPASPEWCVRTFVRVLERFEHMERWPSRAVTGHYMAACAIKR